MDHTVVVKTEMQSNGEILLFYVDENGGNEEGVLTTVQNIEDQAIELQQDNAYLLPDVGDLSNDVNVPQSSLQNENWIEDDIRKLLIFYTDNKQSFISGTTKKKHLWTVACKTMLIGKNPNSCDAQLNSLREKYFEMCGHIHKGQYIKWPCFELCHKVFHDEIFKNNEDYDDVITTQIANVSVPKPSHENVMVVKKVNNRATPDEKVELMLKLYLKYKKSFQQEYRRKGLWETIAMELGEDDGEYWQKRFLNYKQHYSRLLEKKSISGPESINWPYMDLFDEIFDGDDEFNRKYTNQDVKENQVPVEEPEINWDSTEMTVLVKYCYDCFDEFEDRTIPNNFLWNEIGRLLEKNAEDCKQKYEEMKDAHLDNYIEGGYDMRSRKPIAILFDNIISKEIELEFIKMRNQPEELDIWKTGELDELVQFFYENVEMYKDVVCHYVCWAAVVKKLNQDLQSCKSQWEDLVSLYKTILNDKKENPDMQIDWRYIELFDRIFDYGMDTNLLSGYENLNTPQNQENSKIGVKKIKIKSENSEENYSEDDESFDERGFTKRTKKRTGDSKAFKILEYYQKNKEKFSTTNRNKHSLWEILAKQIGISATQCAHRFRNLKQVYTSYVQREINKPEMPILWPYYALCKKVFGYRAIKNKLKNGKIDSDDSEDWSAKEIKQLINYFSQNFDDINTNVDDSTKWSNLAADITKGENSCKEKFLELRKSYRKLKTMRSRNPDMKISWKYFAMFEQIYSAREEVGHEAMDVDDGRTYVEVPMESDERIDQEEDEYQCIIVIPEGEDLENAQIIIQEHPSIPEEQDESTNQTDSTIQNDPSILTEIPIQTELITHVTEIAEPPKTFVKWTKLTKKRLLINYINYVKSQKGKEIEPKDMWKQIATKIPDKTPLACRKMFAKLKANHRQIETDDPSITKPSHYTVMQKVMRLKPKFIKTDKNKASKDGKIYKDVVLPDEKVEQALQYYLENIEDFVSPRYEKKYLWTGLANAVSEPITKVFNKLNYLKQFYNSDTDEVAGQKTPFAPFLKEILAKEIAIKLVLENEPKPMVEDSDIEVAWSDEETEQLLEWYLSNLEKFKNPKFVRSYLWMEVSALLNKSAIACSKKMYEIRTQYRNMVRETPNELAGWRFLELCQKIYGTGKKGNQPSQDATVA